MEFSRFEIDGPMLIHPRTYADDRGFFTERFRFDHWHKVFPEHHGFIQDNYSWSKYGVLRGLHYQLNPTQGKLVTCIEGSITDIIVDIRHGSPTLGHNLRVELNALKPEWMWVPPGFAHGFAVTSTSGAGVLYKVDHPYNPSTEGSILWNDPELCLQWPMQTPVLSAKDRNAPTFRQFLAASGA